MLGLLPLLYFGGKVQAGWALFLENRPELYCARNSFLKKILQFGVVREKVL